MSISDDSYDDNSFDDVGQREVEGGYEIKVGTTIDIAGPGTISAVENEVESGGGVPPLQMEQKDVRVNEAPSETFETFNAFHAKIEAKMKERSERRRKEQQEWERHFHLSRKLKQRERRRRIREQRMVSLQRSQRERTPFHVKVDLLRVTLLEVSPRTNERCSGAHASVAPLLLARTPGN